MTQQQQHEGTMQRNSTWKKHEAKIIKTLKKATWGEIKNVIVIRDG